MTAECLKNIADFYLGLQQRGITVDDIRGLSGDPDDPEAKVELDKSQEYYEKAMTMMEKLGMDDNKEIFLTLKNLANCVKGKGDLGRATDLLERAESVIAKAKLEEDHMWKIMLKIQWAILYKEEHNRGKEGCEEKAIASMKEGLEMAKTLGKTISDLNSKDIVLAFIAGYPVEFPEDRFPRRSTRTTEAPYKDS